MSIIWRNGPSGCDESIDPAKWLLAGAAGDGVLRLIEKNLLILEVGGVSYAYSSCVTSDCSGTGLPRINRSSADAANLRCRPISSAPWSLLAAAADVVRRSALRCR